MKEDNFVECMLDEEDCREILNKLGFENKEDVIQTYKNFVRSNY